MQINHLKKWGVVSALGDFGALEELLRWSINFVDLIVTEIIFLILESYVVGTHLKWSLSVSSR